MQDKKKFYLTTAITYTSGKPHVGNTYEVVLADLIARAKRMQGYDVFFQTGTDEHGEKIELKAAAAGVSPKQFVDEVAGGIRKMWQLMDASFDKFIRTTDADHERAVQAIFEKLYKQGDIYKGTYKGMYCTPCESFWTESQLVDGKCPDCGREVHPAEEEAYFFNMRKYADRLMEYYDAHPEFITPVSRKNEMVNNFLKPGLQDLCVSRTSFKWGIPVSFDPGHVVYVWLDALTNYITGIGYDTEKPSAQFERLWPADVHIIGKDIVRFHVIYWPIFLMALGLPLPKRVYGHPWLLQNGGKMSKSKGNVIYADDLVEFFGVDAVRYYMLGQMPFENDGLISWSSVMDVINSDLVNVYGNLVQRTVAMANKYFGGELFDAGAHEEVDDSLKAVVTAARDKVFALLDEYRAADALSEIFSVLRRANKYVDETQPWVLAKDGAKADRLRTALYNLAEAIMTAAGLLYPFMPSTSTRAAAQLGEELRGYEQLSTFGVTKRYKVSEKPEYLFNRIDVQKVTKALVERGLVTPDDEAQSEKCADEAAKCAKIEGGKKQPAAGVEAVKGNENSIGVADIKKITIDDFMKVQLRVAHVLSAEKVEKADKLLKLSVQVGDEVRTVVSGIAKYYAPEALVGMDVVLVSNLKPAKLRGIESNGMILCACNVSEDGSEDVVLVSPIKPVASGSQVR